MAAYLQKSKGSEGFHHIIDFLNASHIQYALTENPTIYVSFIKQFWRTAAARISANGEAELTATIDGQVKTITEASLRRHLVTPPFLHIAAEANMRTESLYPKTYWELLPKEILGATTQRDTGSYYPKRYWELLPKEILGATTQRDTGSYYPKRYWELLPKEILGAITQRETGMSYGKMELEDNGGVTTLPNSEIFKQLALIGTPSTTQPPNTQPIPDAEEAVPMPHELPLHSVHSLGRDEGSLSLNELTDLCTSLSKKVEGLEFELKQTKKTYSTAIIKLIFSVKKLEKKVKTTKARRRARIVLSKDEEDVEDSSKQGRKISAIDKDPTISLEDAEIQEKNSADTEILLQEEEPNELVEDQFSNASANLVYIRRSAQKRKDKGKAIMQESEPPKKVKKRVQVQMSMDEELAKKVFEEEQAKVMAKQEQERINFEAALELQKQLDEREEVAAKPTQA
ncbi:hypothetical protein Tco_0103341 [Tanacetum coccineum]